MNSLPAFICVLTDDPGSQGYPIGTRCIWTLNTSARWECTLWLYQCFRANKRTSLNLDIQYMAQKHIGWNSDAINLIKIHLDIFLFYVHSECLNILDYCIVMYKCNIKVVMTTLCTGSPVTRKTSLKFQVMPALLVTGSKRVPVLLPPPSSGRAWRKLLAMGCKREAVGSAASPLWEQNYTSFALFFRFKTKHYLLGKNK